MQVDLNSSPAAMNADRRAALTKQAQIWVSQTFFGTLLKQMRDSPFRSELFSGGRGGQAFSSLFDEHLTQRMAAGNAAKPLVDSIVNKIERSHPNLFNVEPDVSRQVNENLNMRPHRVPSDPRD